MKRISSDTGTVRRRWNLFSQGLIIFFLAIRRQADFHGSRTHQAQGTLHPCFWWWRALDWIWGQALPRQSWDHTLWEFLLYPIFSLWCQVPGCEKWNSIHAWWVGQLTGGDEIGLCQAHGQAVRKMIKLLKNLWLLVAEATMLSRVWALFP